MFFKELSLLKTLGIKSNRVREDAKEDVECTNASVKDN